MNIPRIVIAGVSGDSGKTTISTGIMAAFNKRGLRVQPFKVGPDYIDAGYHTAVLDTPSRNLDAWITSPRAILEIFEIASKKADVAVIEGAMGLFDGLIGTIDGLDDYASTAHTARILEAPVILVVDVAGTARNAAATVLGFKLFDERVKLGGVVLDNVGDQRSVQWTKMFIESKTKVPVVGAVPYNEKISLPSRHMGLIPVSERKSLKRRLSLLVDHVTEHIDVEKLLDIASKAKELPDIKGKVYPTYLNKKEIKLGVAFDEAFNLFYPDNIEILKAYGSEIVFFSPLHDEKLPYDLNGLYLPGGFPDIHAKELTQNQSIRKEIKSKAENGMPIFAECGGFNYLNDSIVDFQGRNFPMVGVFSGKIVMKRGYQALDYTLIETLNNNLLSNSRSIIHGHEFHFSGIEDVPNDARFAFKMLQGNGVDGKHEGWMNHNTLAMLGQIHFAFDVELAKSFVDHCKRYIKR